MSSVTPAGTVSASRMMVEHDALDLEAEEYPRLPEKVHVAALASIARSTSFGLGAGVGAGAAAGMGPGAARTHCDVEARTSHEAARRDFMLGRAWVWKEGRGWQGSR